MRRIITFALAVLFLFTLALPAQAASQASSAGCHATVATDGSCQVTLTVTLHLEQAVNTLTFPLPASANNVTLNGSWVRTQKTDAARIVDLSGTFGGLTGDFSFTLQYTMSRLITETEDGSLQLQLPLLAGFTLPIAALDFSVTLPGEIQNVPVFSSGYHGVNIEKDLTFSASGSTITGASTKELKDRETLTMYLTVDAAMFPQARRFAQSFSFTFAAITVCAILALGYWLLFLRAPLARRARWSTAPEGYCAGQIPCALMLQGADLTMMVFSWAQLGYLSIQTDGESRVLLYKRMDMGNERSSFEQRCFRDLFGKQAKVDCSGFRYIRLCQKVAGLTGGIQHLIHPRSGNPKVFRFLAALIGLFSGGSMGAVLSSDAVLQWLMIGLFAILGGVSSWLIQSGTSRLRGRSQGQLLPCIISCAGWLLVSFLAEQLLWGLLLIGTQLLAGLMTFFGGRLTSEGHQTRAQLLGLRHYLCTVSRDSLQTICRGDPEYFFSMAPCAMALGADMAFARRFGNRPLPQCPYLSIKGSTDRSALQWAQLMRQTAAIMDSGLRQSRVDALKNLMKSLIGK